MLGESLAHPKSMHSCNAAKDVGIADEGSEEVYCVHGHMPCWWWPYYSRIIPLVQTYHNPACTLTVLLQSL